MPGELKLEMGANVQRRPWRSVKPAIMALPGDRCRRSSSSICVFGKFSVLGGVLSIAGGLSLVCCFLIHADFEPLACRGKHLLPSRLNERAMRIVSIEGRAGTSVDGSRRRLAEDPDLVRFLRRRVLVAPSNASYRLDHPELKDPSHNRIVSEKIVAKYFSKVRSGVFFEAGVLDGECLSNTLYLERELGWSGLLVEMTPINVDGVLRKNRKALFAPVCLSPVPWPTRARMKMRYDPNSMRSRWGASISVEKWHRDAAEAVIHERAAPVEYQAVVDCYPLQALFDAAGMARVDFLSLDLEGVELKVLATLDWRRMRFKVMLLDLLHTDEGVEATKKFLSDRGYVHASGEGDHFVFVNVNLTDAY